MGQERISWTIHTDKRRDSDIQYLKVKGYERKYERLQVLNQIIEHTQSFRIRRLSDIDKGSDLGRLKNRAQHPDCLRRPAYVLPRKKCAHCPAVSRVPDDHPYSSAATWCRLPYQMVT